MRRAAAALAAAIGLGGCLTIQEARRNDDALLKTTPVQTPVPASERFEVTVAAADGALTVDASRESTCRIREDATYRRTIHLERTPESVLPTTSLILLGGAAAGWGGYELSRGAGFTSTTADGGTMISGGGAAIAGGGLLLAWALLDLLRTIDGSEDGGLVTVNGPESTVPCRRATPGGDTKLRLASGRQLPVAIDETGRGRVSLIDVPAAELPRPEDALSFLWDDARLAVKPLSRGLNQLEEQLARRPASRVAQDRRAALDAACEQRVVRARRVGSEREEALNEWRGAATDCGEAWSPEREAERQRVETAVLAAVRERLAQRCREGLAVAERLLLESKPTEARKSLESLREPCRLVQNPALPLLEERAIAEEQRLEHERLAKRCREGLAGAERLLLESKPTEARKSLESLREPCRLVQNPALPLLEERAIAEEQRLERERFEREAQQRLRADKTAFSEALRVGRLDEALARVNGNERLRTTLSGAVEIEAALVGAVELGVERALRPQAPEPPDAACLALSLYRNVFGDDRWAAQSPRSRRTIGRLAPDAGERFDRLIAGCR